jgi:hypothetical protein
MVEFASRVEINKRADVAKHFVQNVLGLPWAMLTDHSSLSDFDGVAEYLELVARVHRTYGFRLQEHHFDIPLWTLLDAIEQHQTKGKPN